MATRKLSAFQQAFADARGAGEKEFTFNGKKYHTRTAEDVAPKIQQSKKPVSERLAEDYKAVSDVPTPNGTSAAAFEAKQKLLQRTRDDFERAKRSEEGGESMVKLKKGGSVPSASRRADGIAQRGKTRGKMY